MSRILISFEILRYRVKVIFKLIEEVKKYSCVRIMVVHENNERNDMLICFINSNENRVGVSCFIFERRIVYRICEGKLRPPLYQENIKDVIFELIVMFIGPYYVPLALYNADNFQQGESPSHNSATFKDIAKQKLWSKIDR